MLADLKIGLREVFSQQAVEVRIILLQFLPGVTPVVFTVGMVHLSIHVKPVLHSLSEILLLVGNTLGRIEYTPHLGILITLLQTGVEVFNGQHQSDQMDRVCKLMNQDIFSMILVNLISQHILLST